VTIVAFTPEEDDEIFLGLKEGNLKSLIESGDPPPAESVFHQMLQAIDYLAVNGIVHRDLKPENILYITISQPDNQYLFQLGDFGLCNLAAIAASTVGTPLYTAPEMFQREKGCLVALCHDVVSA